MTTLKISRREMADAMNLERVDPDSGPEAVDEPFAMFDGSRFVFNQVTSPAALNALLSPCKISKPAGQE